MSSIAVLLVILVSILEATVPRDETIGLYPFNEIPTDIPQIFNHEAFKNENWTSWKMEEHKYVKVAKTLDYRVKRIL